MLEARNVTVRRGSKTLVDNASLSIMPGRLTAVIGPNGAGKSTLLRIISGELAPTEGNVFLDGADIRNTTVARLATRRSVVAQSTTLSFPFTVHEVVMLGATVPAFGIRDPAAAAAAREALHAVGLSAFETCMLHELSGGERQRVHIARALCQLATAPRLQSETAALLLDEPTASLDLKHQGDVLTVIKEQSKKGRAVMLVIHDLNLAAAFADEIVLMADGRIVGKGNPDDVLNEDLLSHTFGCRYPTSSIVMAWLCPWPFRCWCQRTSNVRPRLMTARASPSFMRRTTILSFAGAPSNCTYLPLRRSPNRSASPPTFASAMSMNGIRRSRRARRSGFRSSWTSLGACGSFISSTRMGTFSTLARCCRRTPCSRRDYRSIMLTFCVDNFSVRSRCADGGPSLDRGIETLADAQRDFGLRMHLGAK
jgi:heme transport system ATP-binding protein